MTLEHVQPGQPLKIPAQTWNAVIDVARAHQQRGPRTGGEPLLTPADANLVLVKNASGADRARFDVLGIDAPIILPGGAGGNPEGFAERVALSCIAATEADHADRFVMLIEPLKSGAIGRARITGVCPAKIQIDDEAHTTAGVKDAGTVLTSGKPGVTLLWKEAGTGVKWAVVQMQAPPARLWIKLDTASSVAPNRWAYSYRVVVPKADGTWENRPDQAGQETYGLAYNTTEANNTATQAGPYDLTLEPFATQGAVVLSAAVGAPVVEAAPSIVVDGVTATPIVHFTLQLAMRQNCEEA